jgi:dolichol-phosphate mannosyltransferase
MAVELSVVVPVYGCEECLRALHRRLGESLEGLVESYEIVYVDDRSPDGAWDTLTEIARDDPAVRVIRLSRNFGQHPAITAGLAEARGRWVVVTDCDLEDPPEEIPRLYAKAQEGFDVVLCRREARRQSLFRRFTGRMYRRLANMLAQTDVDLDFTNLSILSRKVVDAMLSLRDVDRQYLLMILWLGFESATIEVRQDERYAGSSSYSFAGLVRVAADGIFFQTTKLLRWIIYGGFVIAALGILAAAALVGYSYFQYEPPPGWASLAVLVMVLSGVTVISTGVTGLYVGKVFGQVKGRPLYVVDETLGGDDRVPVPGEAEPAEPGSVRF